MAFVLIIGLTVAVIALGWFCYYLNKSIKRYEQESIKKTRKNKK